MSEWRNVAFKYESMFVNMCELYRNPDSIQTVFSFDSFEAGVDSRTSFDYIEIHMERQQRKHTE